MNVLFISSEYIGYFIAKRLADRGHKVFFYSKSEEQKKVGDGLSNPEKLKIPTFKQIKDKEISILMRYLTPYLKKTEFVFFDDSGMGKLADRIRSAGYKVVGASEFMDKIEIDRVYAYEIMEKYTSVKVSPYQMFTSIKKGIEFLENEDEGIKYVFKLFDDGGEKSLTYMSIDAENESLIEFMQTIENDKEKFILQQQVNGGVEISTEGWFNGKNFVDGAWNHTFEKKRLMNDDMGAQTGCSGSVIFACDVDRIVRTALLPLAPLLRKFNYTGPIDVNLIITGEIAWFLEFCGRCGYSGIDCFLALIQDDPGEFLYNVATGKSEEVNLSKDYSLALGLSTYPLEGDPEDQQLWAGVRVLNIPDKMEPYFYLQCHYWDDKGVARATGSGGSVGTVVSTGETIEKAKSSSYNMIDKCKWTKDLMYRTDIGDDVKEKIEELENGGWL